MNTYVTGTTIKQLREKRNLTQAELAEKIGTKILVLLMHWEGTAPWAPPFVWPPYGGEEMLKSFIQKLHDQGHLLGVYLSGIGFTEQSNLIAEYNNEQLIEEKGKYYQLYTGAFELE